MHDVQDKLLFTPGPLTTSATVKEAMLHDLGSRDEVFIALIRSIRAQLLAVAGVSQEGGYEAVLMQGSGTFGIEATVGSTVPPGGVLLVIINGAYGERIVRMAEVLKIPTVVLRYPEDSIPDEQEVGATLAQHPEITNVAVVHCETTTGILNPIRGIGELAHRHGCVFMVDAMSSFGAIPLDLRAGHVDFLVTSANKCLEGVPGFAIIIARREALCATEGYARSLSLDLLAQWKGLERNGQFRFTPPTHTLLAQAQALKELADEGGVAGRRTRYRANNEYLVKGMAALGFQLYLDATHQSCIITSFRYPDHPAFSFEAFYDRLSEKGVLIYPGKVSQADCFRIGNIGRIFLEDIAFLLAAIRRTMEEMGMPTGLAERENDETSIKSLH